MAANKKLDMSFLIGVVKRYFLAVVLSGILCGIECFALLYFTVPKKYESRALIYVEGGSQSEDASRNLAESCRVLLSSAAIQDSLIANLDLPYTGEQLNDFITADTTDDAGVIALIVRCGSAVDSQDIVDELADLSVQEFNRVMSFGEADVLSYADPYTEPMPRNSIALFTIAAFLAGVLISFAIAVLHAKADDVIRSEDDIAKLYDFPALADISEFDRVKNSTPHVSYMYDDMYDDDDITDNGRSEYILSDNSPEILFREYDSVKKALVSGIPETSKKIIAVTSSKDSEGKSTVSSNLAVCFAEAGFKVLLIECDMINPTMSEQFGIDSEFGLSSILEGLCPVSEAINEGVVKNLDIIPAGKVHADHTKLIGSASMKTFLEASAENYNYVFLDTPAINTSEDSQLMNEIIAGFIFVIRENSTTHSDVRSAIDKINFAKGNVLGFVKTFSYA